MTIGGNCGIRGALLLGVTASWFLAGCVSTAPHATLVPTASWEQRLPALQAIASFQIDGKIAASDGKQGFSAGLRWRQLGDAATSICPRLLDSGQPYRARSRRPYGHHGAGHHVQGGGASDQLSATLGFEPPLGSLRFWVLGASDPAFPAQESIDDQQRLAHLDRTAGT